MILVHFRGDASTYSILAQGTMSQMKGPAVGVTIRLRGQGLTM